MKTKVSGGFRTQNGADEFAVFHSITDTAKRNGKSTRLLHMSGGMTIFASMFMKAKRQTAKGSGGYIYYVLCGSWRDSQILTMREELLHVDRHDDFDVWEMREVADIVTDHANGEPQSAFYEQLARPRTSETRISIKKKSYQTMYI